jgi:hypothetical protein
MIDFPNHIGYTLRHPLPEVHRASGSSGRRRGHESPPVPAPEGFTSRPSRRQGPGQTARLPIRERFPPDLWSRHLIASPRAGSEPLSLRVELDCSCAFQPLARRTRFGDPQPGRPRTPARYPSRVPTPKRSSPRRKARTRQRAYSRACLARGDTIPYFDSRPARRGAVLRITAGTSVVRRRRGLSLA